ncbi:protoglobin domain-containing protein [Nitrospira sp. Nam74]
MVEERLTPHSHLLQITHYDVELRRKFVDLQPDDYPRIVALKKLVIPHVEEHVTIFFDYLAKFKEAAALFSKRDLLEEAKRLKRDHLLAMVDGDYEKPYVEQRIKLGALYSRAGLDVRIFLGAFHSLMQSIGARIAKKFAHDAEAAFEHFMSLKKVGFFDIGIIVDVLIAERERTISLQQDAIRELSTPALQLRDRLLMLPIIGVLDSHRAKQLTDGLLCAIRANRAKVVVMDVTGVAGVDSKVANHLIQTVAAARLMGATVIVTGLSADVAQTLVTLGVEMGKIPTVGDLQGGIEEAERLLGYKVTALKEGSNHHAVV